MVKIAVLVSGRGSNLQAIINSIEKKINAVIAIVISDVRCALALEIARKHGIKTLFVDPAKFQTREDFDKSIINVLKKEHVDLICLAGFMRILTKTFVQQFKNRIMNIHPSLLPSFPGLNAHQKALDAGVKFSGCTVHFLDEGVDTGPIICQAVVPVLDDDTVESLSERTLKEEHRIYPLAIQAFIEQRLVCEGRKVFWKNEKKP
ncbi:MAG: phosphoribosylglycinamide formyltransferase [Nitrospinota bacterium]